MLELTDFAAFFRQLWGYPPMHWQERLLQQVHSRGWPSALDLPTGSGKTSVLDIALFALALDASREPQQRRQPRRIVMVIDRRTVVDQAYDRSSRIACALRTETGGVLGRLAEALRTLQCERNAEPVEVGILRGGMPREAEWARAPNQPNILISTVDQVGSRLLFRGYGVTDRMRPIHAGLLGCDSVIFLDEVHLSHPFEETLTAVVRYAATTHEPNSPRPLTFVRMSATMADSVQDTFRLTSAEREQPPLAARLKACKPAILREIKTPRDPERASEALARACVVEAKRLAGSLEVFAVMVNRVGTARLIAQLAREQLPPGWEVALFTGRMRPLDRDDLQKALLERVQTGRQRGVGDRLLVVSTQALEAGADFDFDGLITECASLDSLRQRFGRVDRLGEFNLTQAVVLARSSEVEESAPADPVYGTALQATWHWLRSRATGQDQVFDFGIEAVERQLADQSHAETNRLLASRESAPVLLLSHLDRWVQTSPIPSADPEVSPFLHGCERGAPEVQVVWRADLAGIALAKDETLVRAILEAVPPSTLEALPLPVWAVRSWLAAIAARGDDSSPTGVSDLADVEGGLNGPDAVETAGFAPAVLWRGEDTIIARAASAIRPGDTVVVPSTYGGLDPNFSCWNPEEVEPVADRGDEAQLRNRGRLIVRWSAQVVGQWGLSEPLNKGPELDATELEERGRDAEREAFDNWRAQVLSGGGVPDTLRAILTALGHRWQLVRLGEGPQAWRASLLPYRMAGPAVGAEAPATEDDYGSFINAEVTLESHLLGVQSQAREFLEGAALSAKVASDLMLAARLHDLGKADSRFQLLLHSGDPVAQALASEPIAKSSGIAADSRARQRARERSRYPPGARHELTSLALIQQSEELRSQASDWDLVLHLVATHHGWCRPLAPPVSDTDPVNVAVTLVGLSLTSSSDHKLSRIDSGLADRFWRLVRRYGWWGLAWLEAVIRLADHRQSEKESRRG